MATTSTSGITFSGLASGMDTSAIVTALVNARAVPIQTMQATRSDLTTKKSVFTTLSSQLSAISAVTKKLDNLSDVTFSSASLGEEFRTLSATSSNTGLFTASVDSARGVTGTHTVTVERLAKVAVSSAGNGNGTSFSATTSAVATGTLAITVGSTTTNVSITSTNATLTGVRDAINASGAAVRATTIYDGTGYKLVVTGTSTGEASDVTVDASGLDQGDLSKTLSFTKSQSAVDSRVVVDGVAIEHADNVVEDALYGVTLSLSSESATAATLSVKTDTTAVSTAIKTFIANYNAAISNINSQNTYSEGQNTPVLFGNSTVRGVEDALARAVSEPVSGTSTYKMLADVGIHLMKDGTLTVDESKLSTALGNDFEGVRSLFVTRNGTDGVAGRVTKLIDTYVNSSSGLIKNAQDGLDAQVEDLDDRIDAATRALESYQETITRQFIAMESAISMLKGQQTSLNAIFNSTSSSSK